MRAHFRGSPRSGHHAGFNKIWSWLGSFTLASPLQRHCHQLSIVPSGTTQPPANQNPSLQHHCCYLTTTGHRMDLFPTPTHLPYALWCYICLLIELVVFFLPNSYKLEQVLLFPFRNEDIYSCGFQSELIKLVGSESKIKKPGHLIPRSGLFAFN